jgi:predicted O-methyltransferase YrrM
MNIHKAKDISGWMDEVELTWLAQQAETHTRIIEIGSYLGRSCRALCDNTQGQVTAVDTWGVEHPAYGDITGLFAKFQENMIDCENLRVIKMMSLDAAKELAGETFDMVFIDADHSYEAVKADIEAWMPLVISGGLLCGHDYDDHEEVKRAVDELLPGAKAEANSIWAITKSCS